jgi:hypothetical protein
VKTDKVENGDVEFSPILGPKYGATHHMAPAINIRITAQGSQPPEDTTKILKNPKISGKNSRIRMLEESKRIIR